MRRVWNNQLKQILVSASFCYFWTKCYNFLMVTPLRISAFISAIKIKSIELIFRSPFFFQFPFDWNPISFLYAIRSNLGKGSKYYCRNVCNYVALSPIEEIYFIFGEQVKRLQWNLQNEYLKYQNKALSVYFAIVTYHRNIT